MSEQPKVVNSIKCVTFFGAFWKFSAKFVLKLVVQDPKVAS